MSVLNRAGFACVAVAMMATGIVTAQQPDPPLRVLGQFTISTGFKVAGVEFGGISGLDYDPSAKRYIALSDDRASKGPVRTYDLAIDVDSKGVASLEILRQTGLVDASGKPHAEGAVDPEEIRLLPNGNLVWADEGTATGAGPALIEITRAGAEVGGFELPAYYKPAADKRSGVRDNLGHEGLATSPDGTRLIAVLENALAQDGPIATPEAGSRARMIAYDLATRRAVAEYAYDTEPIPAASPRQPPVHDNGVSSAVYLRDGRLLVMERSFALGLGNTIQIFAVDIAGATNVLGRESLAGAQDVTPVKKTRLLTLKSGEKGQYVDNLEAMSQGPDVDGRPTLVLASDNNFNRRGQLNQILVLEILR